MLHKSLGMTALVLAVLRVVYRAIAGAPPYGETLAPLMRAAAHVAHFALYALMIALPVVGYVASTAGGHEVSWFGLFVWPALVAPDKALGHLAIQAHFWLGWTIVAVLALHRRRGRLAPLGQARRRLRAHVAGAGPPSPARANGAEASPRGLFQAPASLC